MVLEKYAGGVMCKLSFEQRNRLVWNNMVGKLHCIPMPTS